MRASSDDKNQLKIDSIPVDSVFADIILLKKMELVKESAANVQEGIHHLSSISYPLSEIQDLDPLMDLIKDARYVLLGESTHGTHEFYIWRARLTKRLIREKNFSMVAVEGDWPDCYRINQYVKKFPSSAVNAKAVLNQFKRWPTWMWANWETMALMEWIRTHNYDLPNAKKVGFYGLDVYSLWESMAALDEWCKHNQKETRKILQRVMDCFDPFSKKEGVSYAQATQVLSYSCEAEVQHLLKHLESRKTLDDAERENEFNMRQNALVSANAEKYYRKMLQGDVESWNIRDRHMAETINRLSDFHGENSKMVIWEHNSHIGDARATDMSKQGMLNVGQLLKEQREKEGVIRIGFGTNTGTVTAASNWGGKMQTMNVPAARDGSWESLLHQSGAENKIIISSQLRRARIFRRPLDHRAIGVVYRPEQEHYGNYVPSILPERYEAFVYLDETSAIHPYPVNADATQMPETYPFGV